MPRRALVTGASGCIGKNLSQRLLGDGWQVWALIRPQSRRPTIPGLRTCSFDGGTDSLLRSLAACKPDVVFHLAALYVSEHSPADVRPLIEGNILLGCQLAEAMARSGALRLVNTGTAWQHFRDAPYDPVNLYAATKQAIEDILVYYQQAHGLKTITLKIFDSYGPDDPRPKLLAGLRRAAKERVDFVPGGQLLDLVHVDDLVNAFVMAGKRLLAGKVRRAEAYALSSGRPRSVREVAAVFEAATGLMLKINWGARPYRRREVMRPWAKGEKLPGWKPRISLEEGFRQLEANAG